MKLINDTEKEISIEAQWGKIAGVAWGSESNPPVLLCHGKLDTCSGFRPLVTLLPDCFYYVGVDLPGNGRSDHLPKGLKYTVVDLVPVILRVVEHFQWNTFRYIGHSLGVPIGKLFDIAYPGRISRAVELDPIPAYRTWPITREGFYDWYHRYYDYYSETEYTKFNGSAATAPKYTYEQARQLVMHTRGLSQKASEAVLDRCLVPAEDTGLFRFTFDQRMKKVTPLPFSSDLLRQLYTTTTTPTYCILATRSVTLGFYDSIPFVQDPAAWRGEYRYKVVEGGHDLHIETPEYIADDIAKFLLQDKAKL